MTATDISEKALLTARQNARSLHALIDFVKHDILTEVLPGNAFDLIVSNPPYISEKEKKAMSKNVLDYEPHLALFAGPDPLIFYKMIAEKGKQSLNQNGAVIAEINEHFGKEVSDIFREAGFIKCQLIKDLQQKDRVLIANVQL